MLRFSLTCEIALIGVLCYIVQPISLFIAGLTSLKSLQIASSKVTDNGVVFLRGSFTDLYEKLLSYGAQHKKI